MAEIPLEKKSSKGWLWALLALLVIILLAWWLLDNDGDDTVEYTDDQPAEIVGANTVGPDPVTPPEPVAMEQGTTIGDILGDPTTWVGRDNIEVGGVMASDVPTDRGFWIEDQGQRIFAVLLDGPMERPVDIDPGERLVIGEAMARDATFITQIPGEIDPDTRRILQDQDVFLIVDEDDIEGASAAAE